MQKVKHLFIILTGKQF